MSPKREPPSRIDLSDGDLEPLAEDLYGGGPEQKSTPAPDPSDAEIRQAVVTALEADDLEPGAVQPTVQQGWVTLDGQVDTWAARGKAEHDALDVEGVRGVQGQVRVQGADD